MQLPAYLQGATSLSGLVEGIGGMASPPRVSIKANRFTLIDATGKEIMVDSLKFPVIVQDINLRVTRQFYKDAYDPGAKDYKPPTCTSDDGIAPLASSVEVQSPTCAACRWNEWGSSTSNMTGKATKACQDGIKIAVQPIGVCEDMVFLLRIGPGSFKNWAKHVTQLEANKLGVNLVVTVIEFESQGVLKFSASRYVSEEEYAARADLDFDKLGRMVGRISGPTTAALEAPPEPLKLAEAPKKVEAPKAKVEHDFTEPKAAPKAAAPAELPQDFLSKIGGAPAADDKPKGARARRTKAELEATKSAPAETDEDREAREFREWKASQKKSEPVADAPQDGMFGKTEDLDDEELSDTIAGALNLQIPA